MPSLFNNLKYNDLNDIKLIYVTICDECVKNTKKKNFSNHLNYLLIDFSK
jgi:hypothetical protein